MQYNHHSQFRTSRFSEGFITYKEEIDHFEQVHNIIVKRGLKLGRERKDEYVNELYLYMKKSSDGSRVS
jgi:tRNA isopentenyl-2-thiomethyl-A-37 hydroxylase MiaE